MNYLLAFLVLVACFALMAVGVIFAKKVLKRGCSLNPQDCACRKEGKDPSACDKP